MKNGTHQPTASRGSPNPHRTNPPLPTTDRNPDPNFCLTEPFFEGALSNFATTAQGFATSDNPPFIRAFWEVSVITRDWVLAPSAPPNSEHFTGRTDVLLWEDGNGAYWRHAMALKDAGRLGGWKSGAEAWGKDGILVAEMSSMPATLYTGEMFDHTAHAILPRNNAHLPAIWVFCSSGGFREAVRNVSQKLNVTNQTLVKIPFDLAHWQKVAAEKYPNGLPEPESDDPTQWIFHGFPGGSVEAASSRFESERENVQVTRSKRQDAASTFGFFDREAGVANLRGNLPHWRQAGTTYFVTFRADDSIPEEKLKRWLEERAVFLNTHPEPWDDTTRHLYKESFPARLEEWLDAGHGACLLARPDCKEIVGNALKHFDGQRYHLDEFVVMPNHVHALVTPMEGHEISDILQSWKSFTANRINKAAGRTGTFWQKESFDHIVRSPAQLEKIRQYIRENPRKVEAASSRLSRQALPESEMEASRRKRQDAASTFALQVAVARLLGYRWPPELDAAMRLSERARALVRRCGELSKFVDDDGIVAIPGVRTEEPASERLTELLRAAYGSDWTGATLNDLITRTGCKAGTTLDDWLRGDFFAQHCKLFHNRPFVWHVWDGRKDGFSALVNYHKLNHKTLENLAHSYLQDWINAQNAAAKAGATGADLRLKAAQELQEKLKLILAGEPPYDIFVRWKPLHEQAIGWNPDLNDGVRMNIRPFMEAGVLRKNPNIKWTKDRGKEPQRDAKDFPWFWDGGKFTADRVNDVHLTNAEKQAARGRVKKK